MNRIVNLPVNSIALSKSAFSELGPFSGSSLTGVFRDGTTPENKNVHNCENEDFSCSRKCP